MRTLNFLKSLIYCQRTCEHMSLIILTLALSVHVCVCVNVLMCPYGPDVCALSINRAAQLKCWRVSQYIKLLSCEAPLWPRRFLSQLCPRVTISSIESSCLAICSPLHVSVHCRLFFVQSVQEARVCACSQCHHCRLQRSLNSSFLSSMARDTASCVSGSNCFH